MATQGMASRKLILSMSEGAVLSGRALIEEIDCPLTHKHKESGREAALLPEWRSPTGGGKSRTTEVYRA